MSFAARSLHAHLEQLPQRCACGCELLALQQAAAQLCAEHEHSLFARRQTAREAVHSRGGTAMESLEAQLGASCS
jgi:hypothetical protein